MKPYRECVSVVLIRPVNVCEPGGKCSTISEILLVHKPRKHDDWQLPQGGIEKGESLEHAAKREILEETGIQLSEAKPRSVFLKSSRRYAYDYPKEYARALKPPYRGQRIRFLGMFVPPETTVRVDGREVDGHIWVPPEEINRYVKRREYLKVVGKVLAEFLKAADTAQQ